MSNSTSPQGIWVVIYCQYGDWSVTCGFASQAEAERHADLHLRQERKTHIQHVESKFIETPAGSPVQQPRRVY